MNSLLILLLQENVVEEKLKNAPDNGYAIGVLIGYLLPLIVLAAFAYLLFSYMKNRNKNS
ncbi:hypothetical protein SAMN05216480_101306 [Pustulibacterium marinum]|uniref:Uncharacterized protein n=1 Tax=Pustulibacterium marinum TaxID=1224947 RepID=A0A1I7EVP7_9FLAO|nr:hypothetical protein [Pustulibacterium marinum]SFU27982.1 hypothetical protein SAMN05216480_101306 [Pustulibacterium marinum]